LAYWNGSAEFAAMQQIVIAVEVQPREKLPRFSPCVSRKELPDGR
jgi:hypothetical protein